MPVRDDAGMADYSEAASNAESMLETVSEGMVEEYEIRSNGRRVRRGKLENQVQTAALLEGLAARRSKGLFNLAKIKNPR